MALFQHGDARVLLFVPQDQDNQQAHKRDELYFIQTGQGIFKRGGETVRFHDGDVLFVAGRRDAPLRHLHRRVHGLGSFFGPEGGANNFSLPGINSAPGRSILAYRLMGRFTPWMTGAPGSRRKPCRTWMRRTILRAGCRARRPTRRTSCRTRCCAPIAPSTAFAAATSSHGCWPSCAIAGATRAPTARRRNHTALPEEY